MRLWRGVSKSMFTCFLTEDSSLYYAEKYIEQNSSAIYTTVFWRDRQPCLKEQSDAQACVRPTTVLFIFARGISFQSAAIFLCPKGTTRISHGTRTKCRKTRAMLRDFSTVACLALRQLRHFYGTRCSFAKIAIPYTIYPSLSLFEFDVLDC